MEEEKPKSKNTIWIVIICVVIAVVTIVVALAIWLGFRYVNSKIDSTNDSISTTEQSTTSETQTTPAENPEQVASNFLKSIFSTFPGSSINLVKAKTYLATNLQSQVNTTKESYWDLHGYIHSGPCSVAVSEISNTSSEAVVEITTEWGEQCMGMAEPYYRYKISVSNNQWIITEIEQLKPATSNTETIPRDF